jgi:hypothetical protein
VIVTFLEDERTAEIGDNKADDGSLEYLFRGYVDDCIREPPVDFGEPVGNERW